MRSIGLKGLIVLAFVGSLRLQVLTSIHTVALLLTPSISHVVEKWEQRLNELKEHRRVYGDCHITKKRNGRLNKWVNEIREIKQYLSDDMIAQLDELGFEWERRRVNRRWRKKFKLLKQHQRLHNGKIVVPKMDASLASFVYKQRAARREGTLPSRKIQKLDSIGFPWQIPITTSEGSEMLLDDRSREALSLDAFVVPSSCCIPQDWEAYTITFS